jgi:hypothetical protein
MITWPALLVVLLLAACGAVPDAQTPEGPGANGTTMDAASRASGILFPQVREGLDGGPDAAMGGKLVLDDEGCLRVKARRGPALVPVWPANLKLETGDGKTRAKDRQGRTVAEVGKEVFMGGGQIGLPKNVVSPRTARELRDRCSENPADYWIAVAPSLSPVTQVGSITPDG